MSITDFFVNQEIFVTGGSGFIGKALIEKLLHSCSGLAKIYVLLRSKKGKTADERLQNILQNGAFERLRLKQPKLFEKLEAIEGDCAELGLGISDTDLKKLQNVSIIYHSAASVRFDDQLRDAILLNTRGTYELIKIAEKLRNLRVFMHVSTTYCNPDKRVVEEKIYPPYADWRTTIKLAETMNADVLNILNPKYSQNQPNTYTFTKSLAEQIISEYNDRLPVVVFRPSIVISAIDEPAKGWIDNFNGPVGMLVACGIGIMRTNYADPDITSDFVPVDIVVRALILATCKKARMDENSKMMDKVEKKKNDVFVVNCATAALLSLTLGQVIERGKVIIRKNPMEKSLWVPGGSITRCWFWNVFRIFVWQIMMAIIVDSALRLAKQKPLLLRLQRRIYHASSALHYFMITTWDFKHENFFALDTLVPKNEFLKFGFLHYGFMNPQWFLYNAVRGAKQYLLNEPPQCSSRSVKLRIGIFNVLNTILEFSISFFILRFLFRYFQTKFYSK